MSKPQGQRSNRKGNARGKAGGGPAKEVIDAPYNFVPLSEHVIEPEWAGQVSHDLPFRDGLCGQIDLTLHAESPLLVGGSLKEATNREPGEVHFFKAPDGRYAIPGSSLKGMVRGVLEILTFSRMNAVDDKRFGLRDITGKHVKEAYTARVRDKVKAGFLCLGGNGAPEIVPCRMARFSHRQIADWWGENRPLFKRGTNVADKYKRWEGLCNKQGISPWEVPFNCSGGDVTALGNGSAHKCGFPVLTGQVSEDGTDKHGNWKPGKHRDFLFYDAEENERFLVHDKDAAAWRDFLFIHGDEGARSGMPWPAYWKRRFWQGDRVPVFYVYDGRRLQIGLAYMPKLAGDFSVHDMVRHTSEDHMSPADDFASLIFGHVEDGGDGALKGRVHVEPLFVEGDGKPQQESATILNAPKPSYFPNYLEQPGAGADGSLSGKAQYATYIQTQDHSRPRLRGWKRYPARPEREIEVQALLDEQKENPKVQVRLHPLPKGTRFSGRVVFHNLKPEELGALLWALDLGGEPGRRHTLGMGKSFGFGQVRLELKDSIEQGLTPNDPESAAPGPDALRQRFEHYMDEALGCTWRQTRQVGTLLAMTDPGRRAAFPGALRHMTLGKVKYPGTQKPLQKNEFVDSKKAGLVLAPYELDFTPSQPTRTPASYEPNTTADDASKGGYGNAEAGKWIERMIAQFAATHNMAEDEVLRGKMLAAAWEELEDGELKDAVRDEIERIWREKGWWEGRQGRSQKAAKRIYWGEQPNA